jgi:hypothetical protein
LIYERNNYYFHQQFSPKGPFSFSFQTKTMDCCADCGSVAGGGVSLKVCKACMLAKESLAEAQERV